MKKVMVFNFQTMQFEQASEEAGKELLSLIGSMNADCAAQHTFAPDVCPVCLGKKIVQTKTRGVVNCASCNGTGQRR